MQPKAVLMSPCAVNSLNSSGCLDHPSPLFPVCRHISYFRQLHSSYFMYLIHPFSSWSFLLLFPSPCASIIPFSNPSDRITCPRRKPSFLLSVFVEAFLLLLFQSPCVHFH